MHCPSLNELPPPPPGKSGWPWTEGSPQLPDTMPGGSPWPRVSIVTPSYNQGRFIEETIRSMLLQGYPHLEYIVIDGGSTDSTLDIIRKYDREISCWTSEPDRNMYDAINKGMERVSGEYWAVLNSDDYYLPDTVQKVVDLFRRHPDMKVVTGAVRQIDGQGNYLHTRYPPRFNVKSMIRMRTNGIIAHPATFMHREVIDRVGKFNVNYPVLADYDYLIRIGLAYPVLTTRSVLVTYRVHGGKLSFDESRGSQKERNREVIVNHYREACDVNMGLVWWDRLRVSLCNPTYLLRRRWRRLRALLGRR